MMNGFDTAAKQRFIDALKRRLSEKPLTCPFCSTQNWVIADGFVMTPLSSEPSSFVLGGPSLPSAALVCTQCGNTAFFNLAVLNLRDLVEIAPTAEGEAGFPHVRSPEES